MCHNKNPELIWIAWEKHRRTTELFRELSRRWRGIKLFQLQFKANRSFRYLILLIKTFWLVLRYKSRVVIVQNPSVVLSLAMVTIGKVLGRKVIVDSHNEGLKPYYEKYMKLFPVYRFIQRKADMTIVTNEGLARDVLSSGGKVFILPDKLPEFDRPEKNALKGEMNLTFVCTFEKDEPWQEVLDATVLLPKTCCIYVTGRKGPSMRKTFSFPNLIFTGYLPDDDYVNLLYSSDGIIDLTKMEDCLVCGGYEGVTLKKPLILSDTKAIRDYFRKGCIYTGNSSLEIAEAIGKFIENKDILEQEIAAIKPKLERDWGKRFNELCKIIENMCE